ncbi:CARDB domain-containing protein [Luteimonas suaedae]|uniref:CARDB domain-containing protein n=1 Tax=Luteimonas suaedae TaxID=2605430 RepID=UPI0016596315|nr:CARDB domain-containing protein [Luteimonas suaedae]
MSRHLTMLAAASLAVVSALDTAGAQPRLAADQPADAAGQSANADDPVLRAVAVPPQQGDDGGPGQGRQLLKVAVMPVDLSLVGAFTIGNGPIGWGTSTELATAAAAYRKGGRCAFRYAYPTRNQGPGASAAAVNRILLDAPDGSQLAQDPLPPLAAGAPHIASGHVLLAPGVSMLYVHADAAQQVAETDENNNLRRVRVTVKGECGPTRGSPEG